MNKKQKLVLAIFVPIIIFFIALIIANSVGVTYVYKRGAIPSTSHTHDPFDLEKTWYVWMFYFILCGIFEYKLFADKKANVNRKYM